MRYFFPEIRCDVTFMHDNTETISVVLITEIKSWIQISVEKCGESKSLCPCPINNVVLKNKTKPDIEIKHNNQRGE